MLLFFVIVALVHGTDLRDDWRMLCDHLLCDGCRAHRSAAGLRR